MCGTSKLSSVGCIAFRLLHAVLSRKLTRIGYNTCVMNHYDLHFLLCMVAWQPIHISHALACQLHHQSQDSPLAIIFLGPYITKHAPGLGLIDCCSAMQQVGLMQSLKVTMLQAMHMIKWRDTTHEVQFQWSTCLILILLMMRSDYQRPLPLQFLQSWLQLLLLLFLLLLLLFNRLLH